jgi:NAD(P)-dependent dehydrogenase (short-subunit alcohol dehydrogenase family)
MTGKDSGPVTSPTPPPRELLGKVVLVTGGAVGIGRAICVDLAQAGAYVVVTDKADPADTVAEIEESGAAAIGVVADVTSEDDLAGAVGAATRQFGGVDILVNNAGIFATLQPGPFDQISVEQWRNVMDVNVLGGFLAARAVVGSMRRRGGGRIVNIASTTAFKGVSHLLHYTSSKGAVLAMTKALARELGADRILVNAVAPGFTVSTGVEEHPGHVEAMRRNAPSGRVLGREMSPADIVGAVRFLAGPTAGFITGQTIVVDGGAYFH